MEISAGAETDPGHEFNSDGSSSPGGGFEPNGESQANRGPELSDTTFTAAVSIATAQLGVDLRSVGSQILNIETGQRAIMEQLQRIAEQADERARHQYQSLQQQVESTQRQVKGVCEEVEVVQTSVHSLPEQLQITRNRLCDLEQGVQAFDHRLDGAAQQLRIAESKIQTAENKHEAVEQRLRVSEQKHQFTEQRSKQTDSSLQTALQQLQSAEQQLQAATQQLQEVQQKLAHADQQMKTCEQKIEDACKHIADNAVQVAEIKAMFDEQAQRRANVEISIGELSKNFDQLKAELPKKMGDDKELKTLQTAVNSSRRMHRLALVVAIASLFIVGYLELGKPGWPIFARYVSLWLPGSMI